MAELDWKDVTTLIADMLLAGIDTSSYTTGFLLYQLATNQKVVQKIREEISKAKMKGKFLPAACG